MTDENARLSAAVCRDVPAVEPDDIDERSIGSDPSDGMYAADVHFRAAGRKFLLLDKDGDGVVDFAFSYGSGSDWCHDHDGFADSVVELLEDTLDPLHLEIPAEYRVPDNRIEVR